MNIYTAHGLGSAVALVAGGQGYITSKTEKLGSAPTYEVLTQQDGKPRSQYATHFEVTLLPPGQLPGFTLANPEYTLPGGSGPGPT